ncbi:hypothetical protein [Thiocapsa roseopersicina]|uniref:Uncharacterized protein n=1 Tax=Thiocapsa roseopersicina TaxID=1058 RepID=A0A1H3DQ69_THIRO|nr:hypothetical protein [Thiocapsa roseopersicina]SDX68521.1 hypothetical protein SAMN05421783_1559 [Thiocapsa roseopersicina]
MHMTILAETKEQALEVARAMSKTEPRAVYDTGPASAADIARVMDLMRPLSQALAAIAGTDRRNRPTM